MTAIHILKCTREDSFARLARLARAAGEIRSDLEANMARQVEITQQIVEIDAGIVALGGSVEEPEKAAA